VRIALTGGSGFVGSHLLQKLVSEGHEVRVLVRENSDTRLLNRLGVKLVYGDVTNRKSLPNLVNGADIIYHLAANIYTGTPDKFWKVNYYGTRNVLETCLHRDFQRLVFTSTVTVMGSISNPLANESYPYSPTSPYEKSKCEAEKLVLRYHKKFDVPVTVVRPAVVYGPRNMYHLKLYRWIRKGGFLIGSMNNLVHLSYIENLLGGITLAAEKPKAMGEVYIIAYEKPISWRRYVHLVAKAIGVNPRDGQVPLWTVKAVGHLSDFTSWMFGTNPLLTSGWVEDLTKNFAYDISKARRDLGYDPKVTLKEGISRTIGWYRRNGYLR